MSLLATTPIWLAPFPAMVDLPQHAAQIALLRDLQDPRFPYRHLFDVHLFTPYLFGYTVVYLLSLLTGIVVACKLAITMALCAMPILTSVILDRLESDGRLALFCLPAMYGFTYQWGFLSLLLACPIGLCFFLLTLEYVERFDLRTGVALGVFSVALFFCHAMVGALFLVIGAGYVAAVNPTRRCLLLRLLPFVTMVPFAAAWVVYVAAHSAGQHASFWSSSPGETLRSYYHLIDTWTTRTGRVRVADFLPELIGARSRALSDAIGLFAFAIPILLGARPSRRPALWVPFLVCVCVQLIAPADVVGIAFVYEHALPIAIPMYLVLLSGRASVRGVPVWTAGAALLIGWFGVVAAGTLSYRADARQFEAVLNKMARGQRALGLMFDPYTDVGIAPTFLHFGAWYASTGRGVVDPNFTNTYVEPVRHPAGSPPDVSEPLAWRPDLFSWTGSHGRLYRYFIVRSRTDRTDQIFKGATCAVSLDARVGMWWLYETPCAPQANRRDPDR